MADARPDAARRAAARVNDLLGREVAEATTLNASDPASVKAAIAGATVALSAVPYVFNLGITEACIASGVSLCDLGGNTDVVWSQLRLDAGRPNRGRQRRPRLRHGPGPHQPHGRLRDGAAGPVPRGVPLRRRPARGPEGPLALPAHLPRERSHERVRRRGHVHPGREARHRCPPSRSSRPSSSRRSAPSRPSSSRAACPRRPTRTSAASSATRTRCCATRATSRPSRPTSVWASSRRTPVEVDGQAVVPRHLYHRLLEPKITAPLVRDVCVMRAVGVGEKEGRPARVTVDLVDRYDPATGFTGDGAPHRLARRDPDGAAGARPHRSRRPPRWSRRCGPAR